MRRTKSRSPHFWRIAWRSRRFRRSSNRPWTPTSASAPRRSTDWPRCGAWTDGHVSSRPGRRLEYNQHLSRLTRVLSVTSIVAFLFVLGVLIFVHELGHFLMARGIGVRVLTFSLGFGPKLLNIKRGDTEYCISLIPLGGYVKMAGENPEDNRTGAPDEFLSKGKWQRFQVLIMGPVMNLVLAVVVMAVVFLQGAQVPLYEQQPVVIGTFSDNSVAHKA